MVRSIAFFVSIILVMLALYVGQFIYNSEPDHVNSSCSCSSTDSYRLSADGRFVNNYCDMINRSFFTFLKWQFDRLYSIDIHELFSEKVSLPIVRPDMELLHNPDKDRITYTWIGHATVLIQINGFNILTDPIFSDRASPVPFFGPKRQVRLPIELDEMPHIDAVILSHNHPDHLDTDTVSFLIAQKGGQPIFFVPLGVADWMSSIGAKNVQELGWWENFSWEGVDFSFVPVQHWSGRGVFDHNKTLWGGWVIRHQGFSFFFAGDTGYSADFKDIYQRFGGFDLSAIPVGAYEPRWFLSEQHVDPKEAVQIHLDVASKKSFGIHWGTFELSDEELDQPIRDLHDALIEKGVSEDDFFLLSHGETKVFDKNCF